MCIQNEYNEISALRELAQRLHTQLSESNRKLKEIIPYVETADYYGEMPHSHIKIIKKIIQR